MLRKEGKFVSCDITVLDICNKDYNNHSIESSVYKSTENLFDEQMRSRIEDMRL